ncbi:MAG: hypothetical protein AAGF95_13200 [Chloroflexota bacterium]
MRRLAISITTLFALFVTLILPGNTQADVGDVSSASFIATAYGYTESQLRQYAIQNMATVNFDRYVNAENHFSGQYKDFRWCKSTSGYISIPSQHSFIIYASCVTYSTEPHHVAGGSSPTSTAEALENAKDQARRHCSAAFIDEFTWTTDYSRAQLLYACLPQFP